MPEASIPLSLDNQSAEKRAAIAHRTAHLLEDESLTDADRRAAEIIAWKLAEDAVEQVRVELALAIRHCRYLPRNLALKMAHDVDSVACPFLEATEIFSEADWQKLLLTISRGARVAVARRSSISEGVAVALLKEGDTVVAETLIENPFTPVTDMVCNTLLEGFHSEIWVLDKLALREDLTTAIAVNLITHVSEAARRKLAGCYELEDYTAPLVDDAEKAAILQTVKKQSAENLIGAVKSLRQKQKLSASLMLAAIREGKNAFVEAALSVSAGRSIAHVRSVLYHADKPIVEQLLQRAQIPSVLHSEFWTAIEGLRSK